MKRVHLFFICLLFLFISGACSESFQERRQKAIDQIKKEKTELDQRQRIEKEKEQNKPLKSYPPGSFQEKRQKAIEQIKKERLELEKRLKEEEEKEKERRKDAPRKRHPYEFFLEKKNKDE